MKINLLNKFYIVLAAIFVLAMIYSIVTFRSWDRYYYFSSTSAPSTYPVYIRECHFITADNDFAWIKTESVNNFSSRWGEEYYFAEANDKLRLPVKLVIQYASYRDSKFYSDTLDLPTKKIETIFKTAAKNNQLDELYSSSQNVKGLRFVIGIANNGNLLIWLRGIFLEELILKAKLSPNKPTGDQTYYDKRLPEKQYLKQVFTGLSDSIKAELNNGFDSGANYVDTPTYYIDRNKDSWKTHK